KALKLDPRNPYTLNNMGFAREKEGELEDALKYYNQAAMTGSHDALVVTLNKDWRGKPISEVAARNAEKTRKEMEKSEDNEARVARLNLRGVSAMNRNDRRKAREYFQQAFKLDSENAFAPNNMGYMAEMDGDRETPQALYDPPRAAEHPGVKVPAPPTPAPPRRLPPHLPHQPTAPAH